MASIRALTDDRPTYGYRRIWALVNRQRDSAGLSRLNHKRIYRLMSQNGLLLQRYTGKPPGRAHDGQIITIRPGPALDVGWLRDRLLERSERSCAFALDTCDCEVMSWVATTGGISGEMIRDLMLESVERRFNSQQTPHPVEWLSDNGGCYRTHETVSFTQSIGMAESFVKTFKRDYVYVHDRPDAQSVLAQRPR